MPVELPKKQQRAMSDAKCAWRAMNVEQRTELLDWIDAGISYRNVFDYDADWIAENWKEPKR